MPFSQISLEIMFIELIGYELVTIKQVFDEHRWDNNHNNSIVFMSSGKFKYILHLWILRLLA